MKIGLCVPKDRTIFLFIEVTKENIMQVIGYIEAETRFMNTVLSPVESGYMNFGGPSGYCTMDWTDNIIKIGEYLIFDEDHEEIWACPQEHFESGYELVKEPS